MIEDNRGGGRKGQKRERNQGERKGVTEKGEGRGIGLRLVLMST